MTLRFKVLLKLDGEAGEADEVRDISGSWEKRTFIEGEEYELEIGEPCEGKRSGTSEVNRGEKERKNKKQSTNRKNRE